MIKFSTTRLSACSGPLEVPCSRSACTCESQGRRKAHQILGPPALDGIPPSLSGNELSLCVVWQCALPALALCALGNRAKCLKKGGLMEKRGGGRSPEGSMMLEGTPVHNPEHVLQCGLLGYL